MINAEPGTGPSPELVTSLVAHRARDGEVSTLEENYEDPRPSVPHHDCGWPSVEQNRV